MWWERSSYLGVVTLALLAYAAVSRVGSGRRLPVVGPGAVRRPLARRVLEGRVLQDRLPSAWLCKIFPLYRATRVPARFNLFAGVLAGVVAAAGLRHLLARLPRPWRGSPCSGDCPPARSPTWPWSRSGWNPSRPCPPAYAFLKQRNPKATILEIPYLGSGGSNLNAVCTYWQALHRLTTSAGYSGHVNRFEDARIGTQLSLPGREAGGAGLPRGLRQGRSRRHGTVDFNDFVWLYLTVNRFDYIVLHQWAGAMPEYPVRLDRIKALLQESKIYEDAATIVYVGRCSAAARPVHICLEEWQERTLWQGQWNCRIPKSARVVVYNPDPTRDLTLVLDTATELPDQAVRVRAGSRGTLALGRRARGLSEMRQPPVPAPRRPPGVDDRERERQPSRELQREQDRYSQANEAPSA